MAVVSFPASDTSIFSPRSYEWPQLTGRLSFSDTRHNVSAISYLRQNSDIPLSACSRKRYSDDVLRHVDQTDLDLPQTKGSAITDTNNNDSCTTAVHDSTTATSSSSNTDDGPKTCSEKMTSTEADSASAQHGPPTETEDHQHIKDHVKEDISGARQCKKTQKKVRLKSTKKWKPLCLSEVGFHATLLPRFPSEVGDKGEASLSENLPAPEIEEMLYDKGENDPGKNNCNAGLNYCDSNADAPSTSEIPENVNKDDLVAAQRDLTNDADDVQFFKSLGIDVLHGGEDGEFDEFVDWDGLYFPENVSVKTTQRYARVHKSVETCTKKETNWSPKSKINSPDTTKIPAEPLPVCPAPIPTPKVKKCDRYILFELECSSTKKVYIRRDRYRKVEKVHKAVKSKNCTSLFNNRGRKRLWMHHRLVKMHDLNLDFRNSARVGRVPPMPKKNIDLGVAKAVSRADRNSSGNRSRDRGAPKQNLRHVLDTNNSPGNLENDLAGFLISLQHRELTPEDYDMLLRLDDSVKPKTVSNNVLNNLKTETIGPNGVEEGDSGELPMCTICMEPYTAGQERKFLPCQHNFHTSCIDTWLKNSSMNCPLDGLPVESS